MVKKKGVMEKWDKSLVAYTIGIVSIVLAFFQPAPAIILSIVGIVMSKKQSTDISKKAKKYNIIGLIIGIIVLAISVTMAYYLTSYSTFPIA